MKKKYLAIFAAGLFAAVFGTIGNAAPIQWTVQEGGNGHWYEAVTALSGISWTDADLAATNRPGEWYLATITSSAENTFIVDLIKNQPDLWKFSGYGIPGPVYAGPWLGGYASNSRLYR